MGPGGVRNPACTGSWGVLALQHPMRGAVPCGSPAFDVSASPTTVKTPSSGRSGVKWPHASWPVVEAGLGMPMVSAAGPTGHTLQKRPNTAKSSGPGAAGCLLARPIRTPFEPQVVMGSSWSAYVLSPPPLPPPQATDTYTPSLTLSTRPQGPHTPQTPPVVELSNHVWKGSQGPVWQGCQGHHG